MTIRSWLEARIDDALRLTGSRAIIYARDERDMHVDHVRRMGNRLLVNSRCPKQLEIEERAKRF